MKPPSLKRKYVEYSSRLPASVFCEFLIICPGERLFSTPPTTLDSCQVSYKQTHLSLSLGRLNESCHVGVIAPFYLLFNSDMDGGLSLNYTVKNYRNTVAISVILKQANFSPPHNLQNSNSIKHYMMVHYCYQFWIIHLHSLFYWKIKCAKDKGGGEKRGKSHRMGSELNSGFYFFLKRH